jgi:DnaK suppressor protein
MSTTATVDRDVRPSGAGLKDGGALDRLETSVIANPSPPMSNPRRGAAEIADVAWSGRSDQAGRGALTVDQRVAMHRSLERLAALAANRVERVAAVGLAPVAAYEIGVQDAVRDALGKLVDGTYGDCETCRCPIPVARLDAVPYARRCVSCQEREENGWGQVQRLVGGVVRVLAGEPQGRSEMMS